MTGTAAHHDPLLAVVVRGGHAPFSKRPGPLVAVLSGAIHPHDQLEILGRSGTPAAALVHVVGHGGATPGDEDRIVTLDGIGVDDVCVGDVLRRPGQTAPEPARVASSTTHARLLDLVRWARLGALAGPDAEALALLSDEAVVLYVERRLRRALARHTSPFALRDDLEAAAAALQTIGLVGDADRLRVTAAAALEGLGVPPSSATLAQAAELGALTVTDASDRITGQAKGIGALLDLDILEGLASGYQGACEAAGRQARLDLQAEGRAVALGWCRKCHAVTRMDAELKCPVHGKKGQDVVLAVPEDAPDAEARVLARRAR